MERSRIIIKDQRFHDTVTGQALVKWYSEAIGWRGTVLVADDEAEQVIVLAGGKNHVLPMEPFLAHWEPVLEVPS